MAMDPLGVVDVLEPITVVCDAADPESGAELRAHVATVLELVESTAETDRFVPPAAVVKKLEKEPLRLRR